MDRVIDTILAVDNVSRVEVVQTFLQRVSTVMIQLHNCPLFTTKYCSVPKSAMYAFVQVVGKLDPTAPPNSIVIVLPASHPILSNSHVAYDIYCPVAVILYPSSVIDPVPPAQIVPPE